MALSFEIVAFDKKGNKASKNIIIERDDIEQASGPSFDRLNPLEKKYLIILIQLLS